MMNKLNIKTTFTKKVAYPGLLVLILLSFLAALFPDGVNGVLTSIQNKIYKKIKITLLWTRYFNFYL